LNHESILRLLIHWSICSKYGIFIELFPRIERVIDNSFLIRQSTCRKEIKFQIFNFFSRSWFLSTSFALALAYPVAVLFSTWAMDSILSSYFLLISINVSSISIISWVSSEQDLHFSLPIIISPFVNLMLRSLFSS